MNLKYSLLGNLSLLNIKAVMMIIALVILFIGFRPTSDSLLIFGGAVYFMALCLGVFDLYKSAKAFRNSKEIEKKKATFLLKLGRWVEGIILFVGLLLFADDESSKGSAISGSLIWFGSLSLYFISGLIIQVVANIPLDFTMGGWKPKRFKKYRKRN